MAEIRIEDERSEQELDKEAVQNEGTAAPEQESGEVSDGGNVCEQAQESAPESEGEAKEEGSGETGPQPEETPEEVCDEAEAARQEAGEEQTDAAEEAGDDAAQDAQPAGEAKEGGLKGFFHRKDKKDKRDLQIEELTDRVRRQMAEFDNFRKRTEKEKSAMYEVGAKSVIEKILPVVDNFERGLATAQNAEDPFVDGMQKIYKQLMTTLEAMDVKPIDALGQEFNPDLHNAVMHVDDESVGENIVVEELQKGYMYRDSVVRYSMVKVAN